MTNVLLFVALTISSIVSSTTSEFCCAGQGGVPCSVIPVNSLVGSVGSLTSFTTQLDLFGGLGTDAYFALVVPSGVASVTINTCHLDTTFDTQLSLFTALQGNADGSRGGNKQLLVSSNDDMGNCKIEGLPIEKSRTSRVTVVRPQSGSTLYIVIDSVHPIQAGSRFGLNWEITYSAGGAERSPSPIAAPSLPKGTSCPRLPNLIPLGSTASPSPVSPTRTPSETSTLSYSPTQSPTSSVSPTATLTPSATPLPPSIVNVDWANWVPIAVFPSDVCVLSGEGAISCFQSRPRFTYTDSAFVSLSSNSNGATPILFAQREDGTMQGCALKYVSAATAATSVPECIDLPDARASLKDIISPSESVLAVAQGNECIWILRSNGTVQVTGSANGGCPTLNGKYSTITAQGTTACGIIDNSLTAASSSVGGTVSCAGSSSVTFTDKLLIAPGGSESKSICALNRYGVPECKSNNGTSSRNLDQLPPLMFAYLMGGSNTGDGCGLTANGTIVCWGAAITTTTPIGSNFTFILGATGLSENTWCAVRTSGSIACWSSLITQMALLQSWASTIVTPPHPPLSPYTQTTYSTGNGGGSGGGGGGVYIPTPTPKPFVFFDWQRWAPIAISNSPQPVICALNTSLSSPTQPTKIECFDTSVSTGLVSSKLTPPLTLALSSTAPKNFVALSVNQQSSSPIFVASCADGTTSAWGGEAREGALSSTFLDTLVTSSMLTASPGSSCQCLVGFDANATLFTLSLTGPLYNLMYPHCAADNQSVLYAISVGSSIPTTCALIPSLSTARHAGEGFVNCWGFPANPIDVPPTVPVVYLAPSGDTKVALTTDGRVLAWGENYQAFLATIPTGKRFRLLALSYNNGNGPGGCGLASDYSLVCFGSAPSSPPIGTFVFIASNTYDLYCAVTVTRSVQCFTSTNSLSLLQNWTASTGTSNPRRPLPSSVTSSVSPSISFSSTASQTCTPTRSGSAPITPTSIPTPSRSPSQQSTPSKTVTSKPSMSSTSSSIPAKHDCELDFSVTITGGDVFPSQYKTNPVICGRRLFAHVGNSAA